MTDAEYLLEFLARKNIPTVARHRREYLIYYGSEVSHTFVLKEGVIKTSVILRDGREFNIAYLQAPDIISLMRDEVSKYTSAPFNVRVESEQAVFYRVPRVEFWADINADPRLQAYVKNYYRQQLSASIYRQQIMTMNGKKGAVCAFLYGLIGPFGRRTARGVEIGLPVTNEDIAGFCGISTRNSVNRILRELREEGAVETAPALLIKDPERLARHMAV